MAIMCILEYASSFSYEYAYVFDTKTLNSIWLVDNVSSWLGKLPGTMSEQCTAKQVSVTRMPSRGISMLTPHS